VLFAAQDASVGVWHVPHNTTASRFRVARADARPACACMRACDEFNDMHVCVGTVAIAQMNGDSEQPLVTTQQHHVTRLVMCWRAQLVTVSDDLAHDACVRVWRQYDSDVTVQVRECACVRRA
jgi:hypothetical protein